MPLVKVAALSELPPGAVMEAVVAGERYALCNFNGDVHALSGICPHAGGPMGQGNLQGPLLFCPWHAWSYDCRTGENDYDRSIKLDRFPVQIQNGDILLDVPPLA